MSKNYQRFREEQAEAVFEKIKESGVENAYLSSPEDSLRQARLCEGTDFNFVANKNLVTTRVATMRNGTQVCITEMIDKDNNAISVSHLLRRRNGLEHLYDPESNINSAQEALTTLWKSISDAKEKGVIVHVDRVDRYPAGHERADQIRMVHFTQIKGELG